MTDALDFLSELEDLIQDYLWWGVEGSRTPENEHYDTVDQRRAEIRRVLQERLDAGI